MCHLGLYWLLAESSQLLVTFIFLCRFPSAAFGQVEPFPNGKVPEKVEAGNLICHVIESKANILCANVLLTEI